MLDATPGFEAIAEVASGEQALALSAERCPDLVLLDVTLPELGGLETSRQLAAEQPGIVIVLISADDDPVLRESPEAYGAAAFLSRQELRPRTLRALWDRLPEAITPAG